MIYDLWMRECKMIKVLSHKNKGPELILKPAQPIGDKYHLRTVQIWLANKITLDPNYQMTLQISLIFK